MKKLPSKTLTILRYIYPKDRSKISPASDIVPNIWLANDDLRIGNGLDNENSKYHIGTWIKPGEWPVYFIETKNYLDYFLNKNEWVSNAGSVIYIADIDITKLAIGTNTAHNKEQKIYRTSLKVGKVDHGFYFYTEDNLESFNDNLKSRFNSDGRLTNLKGEFFLRNYKGSKQLESEVIFKSDGNEFQDITQKILKLRQVK